MATSSATGPTEIVRKRNWRCKENISRSANGRRRSGRSWTKLTRKHRVAADGLSALGNNLVTVGNQIGNGLRLSGRAFQRPASAACSDAAGPSFTLRSRDIAAVKILFSRRFEDTSHRIHSGRSLPLLFRATTRHRNRKDTQKFDQP